MFASGFEDALLRDRQGDPGLGIDSQPGDLVGWDRGFDRGSFGAHDHDRRSISHVAVTESVADRLEWPMGPWSEAAGSTYGMRRDLGRGRPRIRRTGRVVPWVVRAGEKLVRKGPESPKQPIA